MKQLLRRGLGWTALLWALTSSAGAETLPPAEKEAKLYQLLPGARSSWVLEASGVTAVSGWLYVVFDNTSQIARIRDTLSPLDASQNGLFGKKWKDAQFEGITYDSYNTRNFYALVEAKQASDGKYYALIMEYDGALNFQSSQWADRRFKDRNKGYEGLAWIRRGGENYLLALCEGNDCVKSGAPGTGRIDVLRKREGLWTRVATLTLPVAFRDYSDVALRGNRIAVVSQESAALWLGSLNPTQWTFVDRGRIYEFPRGPQGEVLYCNVEGVTFLDDRRIAVVSDRAGPEQPARCKEKDQSIHLFRLP